MDYHGYIKYRCISYTQIAQATGIGRSKLRYCTCPGNLTQEEKAVLKDRVGDWETFEPQNLKIENGKLVKEGE